MKSRIHHKKFKKSFTWKPILKELFLIRKLSFKSFLNHLFNLHRLFTFISITSFHLSCCINQFKLLSKGTNSLQCNTLKIKCQSPGKFCHRNYLFMFNHFLLFNRQKLNNNGVVIHLSVKMSMASDSTTWYKTITLFEELKYYYIIIFCSIILF